MYLISDWKYVIVFFIFFKLFQIFETKSCDTNYFDDDNIFLLETFRKAYTSFLILLFSYLILIDYSYFADELDSSETTDDTSDSEAATNKTDNSFQAQDGTI